MKKVLFAAVLVALSANAAQAAVITYKTVLSGANENPAVVTNGTGFATVIYDSLTHTLNLDITFSGLNSNTMASHIHCCQTPPTNAGVATTTPTFAGFPLGVTFGHYTNILDLTLATSWNIAFINANGGTPASAEAVFAAGLAAGQAYLNIHTATSPGGEIRGQLTVPEPASMALLGLGIAAAARSRKRRK